MHCPECGHSNSKVVDSRDSHESVRRRRECLYCGGRFTTYERVHNWRLQVAKRDGVVEPFDVGKLRRSIEVACVKRSLPVGAVNQIAKELHSQAVNGGRELIETRVIGEMVLQRLRDLDEVAYIRFASVYRGFDSPERFVEELDRLEDANRELDALQASFLPAAVRTRVGRRN